MKKANSFTSQSLQNNGRIFPKNQKGAKRYKKLIELSK